MQLDDSQAGCVRIVLDGVAVADYVYEPPEPQMESPRPYLLLRTRRGVDATAYRPEDHRWHKGLSLALPNVDDHNFWGGPTYIRGEGYVQLPNNGAQVHRAFEGVSDRTTDGSVALVEGVDWIAEAGATILAETRTISARPLGADAWVLTWRSDLTNVADTAVVFGSPTSRGRENAGYGGLFWRGPVGFTGGEIMSEGGVVGDAARGSTLEWLAYLSPRTDGHSAVGVLMADAGGPGPWFARSQEFAGLCPAPFFYDEMALAPGEHMRLGVVLAIGAEDVTSHANDVLTLARTLIPRTEAPDGRL